MRDFRLGLETGSVHGIQACIPKEFANTQLLIQGVVELKQKSPLHETEAHTIFAEFYTQKWPC